MLSIFLLNYVNETLAKNFLFLYNIRRIKRKECEKMDRPDETIIERDIEKEMKTAYIDYAMSVIVARALPDARDRIKTST